MLNLKAAFFLLIWINGVFGMSLWDQVVKKEQVFLTVEYEKRYLNVWRQDSHGYSKFYVTPLCVMELDSISCSRDKWSNIHRHVFRFNLKLWDSKAAKVVQNSLKQKNVNSSLSDILPLPMQMIRIGLGGKDLIVDADNQWRSNQDQPHVMIFELYTKHEHSCTEMISDAKNNTQNFLSGIKPYFEFTMVVGQNEARNFNLTGKTLQKSAFFSELVNKHADKNGIVYLQSKDLNRLTRNIYNKFEIDELVSAAYIPTTQEKEIINELLGIFKDQQIQSKDLTKDEWNSVFWDDIFSRPDIQTDYANEVFKYDKEEKKFKYDSEKDRQFRQKIENMHHKNSQNSDSANAGFNFFGLFGGNGGIESTEANDETKHSNQDAETIKKDAFSFDDFNKVIKKENINFKWTGMKFEPKDLTLFRLNTRNLNISNEIYFKRVVVTEYQTTQKIEIKATSPSGFIESYIDPNLRYSFQSKKLSFIDAEKYCFKKNGHLVTVNSMFENMFLIEEATSAYNNSTSETFWIGATDTIKAQAWSWVDNSSFVFNNWVKGQPQSTFDSNCGAALLRGGKWISDNCDKAKPFVCEFKEASIPFEPQPIPTICPESWKFYNKTRYCYKAILAKTTWSNAEMLCVKEQAHLASVHNYDENLFIAYLANNSTTLCDWQAQTWIGLSRTDINSTIFKWSDGSILGYESWYSGVPLNSPNNCAISWVGHMCHGENWNVGATIWQTQPCDTIVTYAVCKKALST